jgi:hypothetical protein
MKKHIGLIELAFHNEVLRAYIIALLETDFKISIFSTEFNYNQIYDFQDHKGLSWNLKNEQESFKAYMERVKTDMSNCDLLIISTLPKDSYFNTVTWPSKSVYVVHDNHYYFEPVQHLSASSELVNNTKDNLKIIKFFLTGERKKNLSKIKTFDHLAFPSNTVHSYMKLKPYARDFPFGEVFDFAINDPSMTDQEMDEELIITVPGTINNKSRDYDLLKESLIKLKTLLKQKVTIQILGKSKGSIGARHLKNLKSLESDQLKVVTYSQFIDQKDFDVIMKKTHFMVLPILQHLKFDVCLEKNGYSCVSGNINDIVKYGIPAIVPHYYPLEEAIEKMVMRYDISFDLPMKINEWVENKEYIEIRKNAITILKPFSASEMGKSFHKRILKMI